MKYLIDTNKIIDYLKGTSQTVYLLQSFKKEGLCVSVISLGEILEGIEGQPNEGRRRAELAAFLSGTRVLEVDRKVIERFASARSRLRRKGQLIDNFDILIAATALEFNLVLITDDKDFSKVSELRVLSS